MTEIKLTPKNVGILTADGWPMWSRKCKSVLRGYGLWTYIEGHNNKPPTDPTKAGDWNDMNDRIIGALCQVVENSLAQEIEHLTTAVEAWERLKSKTYQSGAISKFNALQTAMHTRFTTPETVNATIADMKDLIEVIYDKMAPTKEEMTVTLYLHAMADGDFDWLRKLLIGNMTSSSMKLTPDEITRHLEIEAQEARHHESIKEGDKLLAAKQKKSGRGGSSAKCTNCLHTGHTLDKCWEEGGGSARKVPDWWKNLKEKKKSKKEQAHAAITEATDDSGSESCALLHDHSADPYDWNIAAIASPTPYLFDSGATSHCSPYREDFSDLRMIPTREIKGINGASVHAIATGTIYVRCGKGRKLILKNALYIPDVQLRLISIGCLTDDGLWASFTANECVVHRGSKFLTTR